MAESKLIQLNFENYSYSVSSIVFTYVFGMLSLGHIQMSDLVADLFMHSIPYMIPLYLIVGLGDIMIYRQNRFSTH